MGVLQRADRGRWLSRRLCCCAEECPALFFEPCTNVYSDTHALVPYLNPDQFRECDFTIGRTYLYTPSGEENCDPYCGTWECRNVPAINEICYQDPTPEQIDCPPCDEYGPDVRPPYLRVTTEMMPDFCLQFTPVSECCDEACPDVVCDEYGEIIPPDCLTCYDANLLTWAVNANFYQTQAASYTSQNDPTCGQRSTSTSLDVTLHQVVPFIKPSDPNTLYISFITKETYNTTPWPYTSWCNPSDPPPCWFICYHGDPSCANVSSSHSFYRRYTVAVPCMSVPYGPSEVCDDGGLGLCPTIPPNPPFECGGVYDTSAFYARNAFVAPSSAIRHAIGWGGSGVCLDININFSWQSPAWVMPPATYVTGTGYLRFRLSLSLPPRPENCDV